MVEKTGVSCVNYTTGMLRMQMFFVSRACKVFVKALIFSGQVCYIGNAAKIFAHPVEMVFLR